MKRNKLMSITIMLLLSVSMVAAQSVTQMNSSEVNQLLKKNAKIVILDVRTADEYGAGHLKGAKNMDVRQPDFYSRVDKLDKTAVYLVYCRTNHRSGMAVEYMTQHGFSHIYQMTDGYTGWNTNQLPYEKN